MQDNSLVALQQLLSKWRQLSDEACEKAEEQTIPAQGAYYRGTMLGLELAIEDVTALVLHEFTKLGQVDGD